MIAPTAEDRPTRLCAFFTASKASLADCAISKRRTDLSNDGKRCCNSSRRKDGQRRQPRSLPCLGFAIRISWRAVTDTGACWKREMESRANFVFAPNYRAGNSEFEHDSDEGLRTRAVSLFLGHFTDLCQAATKMPPPSDVALCAFLVHTFHPSGCPVGAIASGCGPFDQREPGWPYAEMTVGQDCRDQLMRIRPSLVDVSSNRGLSARRPIRAHRGEPLDSSGYTIGAARRVCSRPEPRGWRGLEAGNRRAG